MNKKKVSPIKWLYDISKNKIGLLFLTTSLGMFSSYCSVRFALITKNIVDIAVGNDTGNLKSAIIVLASFIIAQLFSSVCVSLITVRLSCGIAIKIKNTVFKGLLNKDWKHVSAYHSGELTNRINSDSGIVANGIATIFPDVLSLCTQILFSYFAIWYLDKSFALIYLVVGPLILIASRLYGKKMKSLHKACQASNGKIRSFMQECLQNIIVIKSFSNENTIQNRSDILQKQDLMLNVKRNYMSILANITFFLALTAGYYFALGWCAVKISKGIMTVGTLTAIMQLVGQVQAPFKNLSGIIPQYYAVVASIERITELESMPDEEAKNINEIDISRLYDEMRSIVFENVYFKYDDEYVIEDLSFRIDKNRVTALIGKSGAGKSTVIRLMLGIITPDKGSVYIITDNEEKIYLDKETRKLFAYVPQNIMILSGTILENIMFSEGEADIEKAVDSAKSADIYDYIITLPQGFDTKLAEGGAGLSQGQIQRLAIARAVYHNSPVMLLDEITSALDIETEKRVLANIKNLKKKTCIVVSHKATSIDECDASINI